MKKQWIVINGDDRETYTDEASLGEALVDFVIHNDRTVFRTGQIVSDGVAMFYIKVC